MNPSLTSFQKSVVPFAPPSVVPGTKYSPPSKFSSVKAAGGSIVDTWNFKPIATPPQTTRKEMSVESAITGCCIFWNFDYANLNASRHHSLLRFEVGTETHRDSEECCRVVVGKIQWCAKSGRGVNALCTQHTLCYIYIYVCDIYIITI